MLKFDEINEMLQKYGYEASGQLVSHTLINLYKAQSEGAKGQGIQAICLDGPPGAGKTFYAKTYKKVMQEVLGEKVQFLQYQCDTTTGKSELNEEINIANAVMGKADEVIIPGFLTQAIKKVIDGEKVILFLDEYDKAREETDSYLLDFLQSGRLNTVQEGDLQIPKDKLKNLQVILCKNDVREELSGPLERRLKMIPLDYMKPEVFLKVLSRNQQKELDSAVSTSSEIKYLVSILYQLIYEKRENFSRIPACSELLIAIQDAEILVNGGASTKDVMEIAFLDNVLKNDDDRETFISFLKSSSIKSLAKMFKDEKTCNFSNYINEIASKFENPEKQAVMSEISDIQSKIDAEQREIDELTEEVEELKGVDVSEDEIILEQLLEELGDIKPVKTKPMPKYSSINTNIASKNQYKVGEIKNPDNSQFNQQILRITAGGATIYNDGILILKHGTTKVIAIPSDTGFDIISNQYVWDNELLHEVCEWSKRVGGSFENTNCIISTKEGTDNKEKLIMVEAVNRAINSKRKTLGVER